MKLRYLYILVSFLLSINIDNEDIYDNSWALIIGINDYEKITDLSYGVSDADAIKNLLILDYGFPRNNVKVLLNGDATALNIRKELHEILKNAEERDRVVFYFAGHGETDVVGVEEKTVGYLMAVESELDNKYLTAIPMTELKKIANYSRAKHMLFMVDACYGGLAAEHARGLTDIKAPNYIDVISEEVSRQIITAGSQDEQVISKDEWAHSAFTKSILAGLEEQQADRNLDGVITGSELGNYIVETVMYDTDNGQTPQIGKLTIDRGEMIFIPQKTQLKEEEKEESVITSADLQALINAMQQQKPAQKLYETVILPGFKGFYVKSSTIFLVESVFYTSDGIKYRGKLQINIGMSENESWGPTVSIPIEDVLVMDGSKVGNFNSSTGNIE